jgi:hypothetical protein
MQLIYPTNWFQLFCLNIVINTDIFFVVSFDNFQIFNFVFFNTILWNFNRSSTYLGKLIVAIDNTELSKKIAPYTPNQKVFIKTFYSSGCSYSVVDGEYHRNFPFLSENADWIYGSKGKFIL